MCEEILLYSVILFTSNSTDHMIAAIKKSPVFLNKVTHSLERDVKKKYLYFVKPIRF